MVNLLDLEVSDEVLEKTAELEKRQQSIKNEIRRSRSRESCLVNDSYNNDDSVSSRKQLKLYDSVRSFNPVVINIREDAETSFIDNPADGLYRASTPSEDSDAGEVKLNVHKMNTAIRLNHVIIENSPSSQLVLLNLPRPPKNRGAFQHNYMVYLDVLTENLQRVLFIGGSGKEVISIA